MSVTINDLYMHLDCPTSWKNNVFIRHIPEDPKLQETVVVLDAYFVTESGKQYAVEMDKDTSPNMSRNKETIEKYRFLIEAGAFQGTPVLIWLTATPYRKLLLLELCKGLDVHIFVKEDLA